MHKKSINALWHFLEMPCDNSWTYKNVPLEIISTHWELQEFGASIFGIEL